MSKLIRIRAKCADMVRAGLYEDGKLVSEIEKVPVCFPTQHHGEYINLDIDPQTGQITNWKSLQEKDLYEFRDAADDC